MAVARSVGLSTSVVVELHNFSYYFLVGFSDW